MFEAIQFSSISEFFGMGGYAFNVWSVYALFVLFFFVNLYFPLLRNKQILREQRRRLFFNKEMQSNNGDPKDSDSVSNSIGEP